MIPQELAEEISLNFSLLFIVGLPCYFFSSRGQKIKNTTKIEQNCYCLHSWFPKADLHTR